MATLLPACIASVAATFLLSRVGLAGTILGAALIPVVVAAVKDISRPPAERLERAARRRPRRAEPRPSRAESRGASTRWARQFAFLSWRRVLVTGAAAFAVTVAVFTVPELILGESVTGSGRTTFFTPAPAEPSERGENDPARPDPKAGEEENVRPEPPAETGVAEPDTPATPEAPAEADPLPASPESDENVEPSPEAPSP